MERRLEICVDAPSGIRAALEGGADRLELCAALELGGLTPSLAQIHAARALPVPVAVMIRPRGGDFVYGPDEVELMVQDIAAVRAAGLQGVVFGAQTPAGTLDADVLARLTAAAAGLETTLHRAFDAVPDLFEALKTATALGFTRILTSGGCKTAPEGAARIARLIASARGRILVMPGGGVAPGNARALLEATGAHELHASCSLPLPAPSERLALAAGSVPRRATSAALVRALKAAMGASEAS
jgi:copper homeostasis protein